MKADAILVSAGKGQRLKEGTKKQFLPLAEKPILAHALDPFEACPLIRSILLVVAQEDIDFCREHLVQKYRYGKISQLVPGGPRRQDSVRRGIEALLPDVDIVVIHDGVRPFVTQQMIEESIHVAVRSQAVVFALPVKETIKMVHPNGTVQSTLNRESLWQIQTPQAFQAKVIREAFQKAIQDGFQGTDDASLVERLGVKVHILPGPDTNIKITTREDLMLAKVFLQMNSFPPHGPRFDRRESP